MTEGNRPDSSADTQSLHGFRSNEEWEALLAEVSAQIDAICELSDPDTVSQVFSLLQGIDAIHREALHRLVRLFKAGVLEQVITDPAIRTLMELYDLLPAAETRINFPDIPVKVIPAQTPPAAQADPKPHWLPVLQSIDELQHGEVKVVFPDDREVLICRHNDKLYAIDNRCAQDGSSLAAADLSATTLICPNHPGCLYDIRQGTRIASSDKIDAYAIRIDDNGRILIGLGIEFQASLPSF